MMSCTRSLTAMAVSLLMLTACSDQYKIVNPGADGAEVEETMSRIQASSSVSGDIETLRQDLNSIVYFAKSGTSGLVPETVFSFGSVAPFIGVYAQANRDYNVFEVGLTEASVAFLENFNGEVKNCALLIELTFSDGQVLHFSKVSYAGEYGFSEDMFVAQFSSENGSVIELRTTDLSDDYSNALADNIQFKVYEIRNGQEREIGQFSTLASFGS